jgi:hypothetical protein
MQTLSWKQAPVSKKFHKKVGNLTNNSKSQQHLKETIRGASYPIPEVL